MNTPLVPVAKWASILASIDAIFNASPGKARHQPRGVAAVDRLALGVAQRNLREAVDILFISGLGLLPTTSAIWST